MEHGRNQKTWEMILIQRNRNMAQQYQRMENISFIPAVKMVTRIFSGYQQSLLKK